MFHLKKITAVVLMAAITLTLVTGCGSKDNMSKTVATVGDQKVTFKEANFEARLSQLQYESQFYEMYKEELWDQKVEEEKTLEQSVKEQTMMNIESRKVAASHAAELKITLSDEEKENSKTQAKDFLSQMTEEFKKATQADEAFLTTYMDEMQLAQKVYTESVKDVDVNVTDEEARQAKVNVAMVPLTEEMKDKEKKAAKETADKLLAAADKSKDLTAAAQKLEIQSQETTAGEGSQTLDPAVVTEAMKLKKGEFAPVIETSYAYFILQCVETTDKDATDQRKQAVAQEKQGQAFDTIITAWIKETPIKVDNKIWDTLTFKGSPVIKIEASTAAPETTTGAPETTTAAPESTTAK